MPKKKILSFYIIILILVFLLFLLSFYSNSQKNINYKYPLKEVKNEQVTVYLGNGFENPGFYILNNSTTIADILSTFSHQKNIDINNIDFTKMVKDGDIIDLISLSQTSKQFDNKKDINNATIDDLLKVNGIGEKTATNILSFLGDNQVTSVDELINLKGIGEKTIIELKKYFY